MTRDTSIAVYQQIEAEGLLSRMRWEVYHALFYHGPATAGELVKHCHCRHAAVNARLTELRQMGVARETSERECRETGRTVIEFDVTAHLPSDYTPPPSKRELLLKRFAELEAENRLLTVRVKFLRDLLNRKKTS